MIDEKETEIKTATIIMFMLAGMIDFFGICYFIQKDIKLSFILCLGGTMLFFCSWGIAHYMLKELRLSEVR